MTMDFSDDDFSEDESVVVNSLPTPVQTKPKIVGKKHLTELKSILDLDSYQAKLEKKRRKRKAAKARKLGKANPTSSGVIETLASRTLGLNHVPEVVTFIDHKKRNKDRLNPNSGQNNSSYELNRKELTLDDARFEVFKFGVSGMDKKSKDEANTALAVRLGAKPAKNKCVEYKQLKEERKQERIEQELLEEERKQSLEGVRKSSKNGLTAKKSGNKVKKKGSKSDFKVGSFDGGMLKLSKKDLNSIKSKK